MKQLTLTLCPGLTYQSMLQTLVVGILLSYPHCFKHSTGCFLYMAKMKMQRGQAQRGIVEHTLMGCRKNEPGHSFVCIGKRAAQVLPTYTLHGTLGLGFGLAPCCGGMGAEIKEAVQTVHRGRKV